MDGRVPSRDDRSEQVGHIVTGTRMETARLASLDLDAMSDFMSRSSTGRRSGQGLNDFRGTAAGPPAGCMIGRGWRPVEMHYSLSDCCRLRARHSEDLRGVRLRRRGHSATKKPTAPASASARPQFQPARACNQAPLPRRAGQGHWTAARYSTSLIAPYPFPPTR